MIKDIPKLLEKVTREIHDFTDVAVIGLSGGADSTLVALLCKLALGEKNVYGVHLPATTTDTKTFNKQSRAFAKYINIPNVSIAINPILSEFEVCLDLAIPFSENEQDMQKLIGNAKARLRMTMLYAVCERIAMSWPSKRVRVMGTGNLSENYIGYCTKFGDSGVDIEVIGDLFKSEVYQLLDYFKDQGMLLEEHINRIPSAGLWPGQEDEDEIGHTYAEMELAIQKLKNTDPENEVERFVMVKHRENLHKIEAVRTLPLRIFCED
jgi:NAD+ synthase